MQVECMYGSTYVYMTGHHSIAIFHLDGFDAFLETGDCFNADVASRLRKYIYSSGNTLDPAEAFRLFRGRSALIIEEFFF